MPKRLGWIDARDGNGPAITSIGDSAVRSTQPLKKPLSTDQAERFVPMEGCADLRAISAGGIR